mgnify:CR=1 FL=1
MSEEEKKAIETLKEVASDDFDTLGDDISPKMAQNILNLIDKQQKEIEELKYKYKKAMETNKCLYQFDNKTSIDKFYISKAKIREIFQFYIERDSLFTDDTHKMAVIRLKDILQELLEEN